MSDADLSKYRDQIDRLDVEILERLNARANLAQEIADVKLRESSGEEPLFYRPEREAQLIRALKERNRGPLSNDQIETFFRTVISACLALERPLTIAFLGPHGTYSEAAAKNQFGHFAKPLPVGSITDVFHEVEFGTAHYGVVPVENSTEGMVNQTLDCFLDSELRICNEIELAIHHCLLVNPDWNDRAIIKIYGHEQALAQCRRWLDEHQAEAERIAVASNGEAARIASETPNAAAIAGAFAASAFPLEVVRSNIEDQRDNTTRFLVVGKQDVAKSGHDKSSILVSTKNQPGALFLVLEPFYEHGISLSRIETRPAKGGNWTYVFFIDFDGHVSDSNIQDTLKQVEESAINLKFLGSYPRAADS